MRSRHLIAPLLVVLAVAVTACGGSESSPEDAASASSTAQTEAPETIDRTVTLQPKGNRMQYATTEFSVAPGETVRLVFENTATSPSMQHNVVVLTANEKSLFEKVGEAGTRAGSTNDYVPQEDNLREQVLAYTPMSQPGETVEVTFTVPDEPGEHGYLCTFPGHWATMQGTMIVTEDAAA